MDQILNSYKKDGYLHHAYLIVGDIDRNVFRLKALLSEIIKAPVDNYPDCFIRVNKSFGVEDSRLVKLSETKTGIVSDRRFFILGSNFFTLESQNALLKTVEEPLSGHHIFLLATSEEKIIPTLKSRMFLISNERDILADVDDVTSFIKGDLATRFKIVEELIKKTNDEDAGSQVKIKVSDFVSKIEDFFHKKLIANPEDSNIVSFLEKILKTKNYINDTTPAVRMILEYLILICPNE